MAGLVPAIHVFVAARRQDVDARDRRGHDEADNEVIMYSNVNLFIDGAWKPAVSGKTLAVLNPATAEQIGTVAHAEKADLDLALAAAQKGFETWRKVSAHERYRLVRKAADILRG